MRKTKADIYYLYHSGVAIDTGDSFLVFDYYLDTPTGTESSLSNGTLSVESLAGRDNVYVFVSHNHADHYNPVIFDWQRGNSEIKYIISDDIPAAGNAENIYMVQKYQELKLDKLYIKSFGSTDQGLSFLIKTDNLCIFHAGDLNWWHWKEFSKEELKREEDDFKKEIEKLNGEKIDIAFIPVDPRMQEYYYLAGDYFARQIKPKLLVPIHFADKFDITGRFAARISRLPVKVGVVSRRGEKIVFEKEES